MLCYELVKCSKFKPTNQLQNWERLNSFAKKFYDDSYKLFLQREYLVGESLNQFDFSEKNIFVQFHGEHDFHGISRNFYRFMGKGTSFFSLKPIRSLTTKEIQNLANILKNGYITTGDLLLFVNQAFLYRLLSVKIPSTKFTTSSFCNVWIS